MRDEVFQIMYAQDEVVEYEERLPREPVIQRWLTFSVAPELSLQNCNRVISDWCWESLGEFGLEWFASVHRTPGAEGVAYIVFPQVRVFSMRIQMRKYGDFELPAPEEVARTLSANGRSGVSGRRDLLRRWVTGMAAAQNSALEEVASQWRYDAELWVEKARCRRLVQ